ncbi:MAG: hypothetical protein IJB02_02680 [Oscillospiraceae bacterium]|nr:hypothetical protein [Oscillospiraceae bacterium]
MARKVWITLLALVLALGMVPVSAAAASPEAAEALYESTRRSYTASLSSAGKASFHGFCGTMVAYQLRHLKITGKVEKADGNKMFDRFKKKERSSGGYYITPYSAKKYTLEQALNAISHDGTKDVYNILVGFQWTNTEAGARFGHTVFINGILDGTVYFVESFDSSMGGKEGSVIRKSIAAFAKYYDRWTRFEGCIHFTKGYADSLEDWATDMMVTAQSESALLSQPAPEGKEGSHLLRSVIPGERLTVDRILKDKQGTWYYQVQDGTYTGYIAAQEAATEQIRYADLSMTDITVPADVQTDAPVQLSGKVSTKAARLGSVQLRISDPTGGEITCKETRVDAKNLDLAALKVPVLPQGNYRLTVTAENVCHYLADGELVCVTTPVEIVNATFRVGLMPRIYGLQSRQAAPAEKNGWVLENGSWHFYENGETKTGWFRENQICYYFDETGAAATGWTEIDGQTCLFSATGALCTGWIRVEEGLRYCAVGGRFANGLQNVDGRCYYFQDGLLQTEGTVTEAGVTYTLQPDGQATILDQFTEGDLT